MNACRSVAYRNLTVNLERLSLNVFNKQFVTSFPNGSYADFSLQSNGNNLKNTVIAEHYGGNPITHWL